MDSPFEDNDNVDEMDESSVFGSYYTSICEIMKKNKVPKDRIPSFVHFMSKAFSYIDREEMDIWIKNYIDNEKTDII